MAFMPAMRDKKSVNHISRKSYARLPQILDVPNLVEVQINSFRWFQEEGIKQLLEAVSPINDFAGNRLELRHRAFGLSEILQHYVH